MPRLVPLSRCLAAVALLANAPNALAAPWSAFTAGEPVVASITSGRMLRGNLDARSTEDTLVLSIEIDGVAITSTTRAEEVVSVAAADPIGLPPLGLDVDAPSITFVPSQFEEVVGSPVSSLEVVARPANWDADAQVDGVRLCIVPRNPQGEVVAIGGSIRAELLLETGAKWPTNRQFTSEEQWQREVAANDFGPDGAVLELPFRHFRAEARREFPPLGVLMVRFIVPGHGAFDAIVEDAWLTAPSYNRDRSEHLTGERYFPGEPHPQRP